MTAPVLVVEGGPGGLTMATELVRDGVSVRPVDKAAHRTDKSTASVLGRRTPELLGRAAARAAFMAAGQKVGAGARGLGLPVPGGRAGRRPPGEPAGAERSGATAPSRHVACATRWLYDVRGEV
jgi:FAD binding domain